MNIDRVREERQLVGVDRWFNHQCKGILFWATGVGKSLAFMLIQEMLKPDLTYIVVSEKPHINNWKEDKC